MSDSRTKAAIPSTSNFFNPAHQLPGNRSFVVLSQARETNTPQQLAQSQKLDAGVMNALGIQAQLAIGAPGDKYEQEADAVAAQVVEQINSPQAQQKAIQRQETPEDDELMRKPLGQSIQRLGMPEEDNELMRKPQVQRLADGGGTASANLESSINGAKGNGQPLSAGVRGSMERAFGADFSNVNIHTGSKAHQLNESIQARAFTTGQDIFFRQGEYQPDSHSGQELLAHELTHVVQQSPQLRAQFVEPSSTARPVIQRTPALGALGIGGALSSMTLADAATVVGTVIGAGATGAQAGAAVAPGTSGLQTYQLENPWMSSADIHKLEMITQYRLINAYVDQLNPAGGSSPPPGNEPASEDSPETEQPAPVSDEINEAIRQAVKSEVQLELQEELNANQKTATLEEQIWSDSGAHTADVLGTVGSVQFSDFRGSFIRETLALSPAASQIPNIRVPREGEEMVVKQFRGGRLQRGASWEIGWNDSLAINLVGGAPSWNNTAEQGHGQVAFSTEWIWDDRPTHATFRIDILADGKPHLHVAEWEGTPDDWSLW